MTSSKDLSYDELTLHLIASGLFTLANDLENGKLFALAKPTTKNQPLYPQNLERGLNRLLVTCFRRKVVEPPPQNDFDLFNPSEQLGKIVFLDEPLPQSIPDLFNWCRRPMQTWPLELPPDSFTPNDSLLVGSSPTEFCEHWYCASSDIVAELTEQHFFRSFLTLCRNMNRPDVYIAFRRLLIERPVLTSFELVKLRLDPELALLSAFLDSAYQLAPRVHMQKDSFRCCSVCHNLLLKDNQGKLTCENPRCRSKSAEERVIPQDEGVLWLRRELRRFITMPGQVELQLFHALTQLGVKVDLWPEFDLYDLRLTFADGKTWAVDVKDWASPVRLGKSVKPIPHDSWDRGFFVIPKARCQYQTDYIRAFQHHCSWLQGSGLAVVDDEYFLKLVQEKIQQVNHA